jgi:sugar phosphate isomerase/epimerase
MKTGYQSLLLLAGRAAFPAASRRTSWTKTTCSISRGAWSSSGANRQQLPLIEFDAARIQRLAERAARDGIELEIGGQHLTRENLASFGELARRLRAPILRFVIDAPGYHPAPDEVVQIIRAALPYLEGITLGIENHDRFPARVLRDMIEAVGSESVGVCLDTANSLGAGEGIREVAEVLAPYTVNLHIKDFTVERLPYLMGFTVSGCPAGDGMLNVPELLQQLQPYRALSQRHSGIVDAT